MNQFQIPKGQNPLRRSFASFRLIFRLEKTAHRVVWKKIAWSVRDWLDSQKIPMHDENSLVAGDARCFIASHPAVVVVLSIYRQSSSLVG